MIPRFLPTRLLSKLACLRQCGGIMGEDREKD